MLIPLLLAASISRETIDKIVHEKADDLQTCYQDQLDEHPKLKGKVTVLFTVENDGAVSDAKVKATTLKNEEVEECVLDLFRALIFPDLNGACDASREDCTVKITYPLTFSP